MIRKTLFIIAILGIIFSSCSSEDGNGRGDTPFIQVYDEIWYSSRYAENWGFYYANNWSYDGGNENCMIDFMKADEKGTIYSEALTIYTHSSSFPKKGDNWGKNSTFFAVLFVGYSQYKFNYVSGSATVIDIDNEYITVNLDNLRFTYKGSKSLPYYASKELTVKGIAKCYRD